MKEVPECLWNDLASALYPHRPWWSRHPSRGLTRIDGTHLESANGQSWFVLYGSCRGDYDYNLKESMRLLDQRHPLPKPLPCVGQVWGWPDGTVDVLMRKVNAGGKLHYVFSDDTVYEDPVTDTAFLLQDPKGRFWAPAS